MDADSFLVEEDCPCCGSSAQLENTPWGKLCAVCTSEQEALERDAERQGDWEREER